MKTSVFITIILVILVGAAAFFGGMKYQQSRIQGLRNQFGTGRGFGRFGQNSNNGGSAVRGQISSVDNNSLTITLSDGSSKVVIVGDNTSIFKSDPGSKGDLTSGQTVMVFGTANSDGTLTAQNIQLNPMFRGMATPSATPTQ